MIHSAEKVMEILKVIANEIGVSQQIESVTYREDYQDYQVIIDDNFHCEIREHLIEEYMKTKHVDIRKEIFFRLEHATEFEEWEQKSSGGSGGGGGGGGGGDYRKDVIVDDSANYDY